MPQLWYPAATRVPQPDNGNMTGGPPKTLLHSTESQFGKGWASFKPGTHPHFEVTGHADTQSVSVRQYYPLDQPARSLVDGPLAIRTNRDGVIQVELGFQAAKVEQVPDWFWAGTAKLLRWIEDNAGVNPNRWATFEPYPKSYGASNGVRLSPRQWDTFGGTCGHMHVPDGNAHGDPGMIPVDKLRRSVVPAVSLRLMHEAWKKDRRRAKGLHPIQTRRVQRALGFTLRTGRWGSKTRSRFPKTGPTRHTLEAVAKGRYRVVD